MHKKCYPAYQILQRVIQSDVPKIRAFDIETVTGRMSAKTFNFNSIPKTVIIDSLEIKELSDIMRKNIDKEALNIFYAGLPKRRYEYGTD